MFKDSKYTKTYWNIIDRAKTRTEQPICYCENHHIFPKSCGGSNKKENIVRLTSREHYICHLLLTKMFSDKKSTYRMINAFMRMNHSRTNERYNSRSFQHMKEHLAQQIRGKNNPNFGIQKSETHKENISRGRMGCKVNLTNEAREKLKQHFSLINTGVPKSEEHKKKISVSKRQKLVFSKPMTDGTQTFVSMKECARHHGVSLTCVRKRIKSPKFEEWKFTY
jgi:hypothetical protein